MEDGETDERRLGSADDRCLEKRNQLEQHETGDNRSIVSVLQRLPTAIHSSETLLLIVSFECRMIRVGD